MPVIKLYKHGATSGTPPMKNDHPRAKRRDVQGWSTKSTRSNTAFLRSVEIDAISGIGFAFTLTIRDCPATHNDWVSLRRAFVMRLSRMGMLRLHWLTEWQRRGVPHLHGIAYFDVPDSEAPRLRRAIIQAWLTVSFRYTSAEWSQAVNIVTDALGWLKYLAKHASRGASHYQRSDTNIPEGWKKTGRMWGKTGDWVTGEPVAIELDKTGYYIYRRMVKNWRIADARTAGDYQRIVQARKMLRGKSRTESSLRGTSEWIPERETLRILAHIAALGHSVQS